MAYINWLSMVRAGFLGLEFYNPVTKNWGQVSLMSVSSVVLVLESVFCCLLGSHEGQVCHNASSEGGWHGNHIKCGRDRWPIRSCY